MSKKIQLTIAEPCHENWEAMTDVEKGKFCGSCQKQVVDFTNMSDRQLAEFFKKPSTGSVCGRFMTDQLEREIDIPKKRIPWLKYFFTITIPAFFASKAAAQQPHKTMGKPAFKPSPKDTAKTIDVPPVRMLGQVAPLEITPVVKKGEIKVLPEVVVNCNSGVKVGKVLEYSHLKVEAPKNALTGKVAGPVVSTYLPNKNTLENRILNPSDSSRKRTIKGYITNENNEPVPGASIIIKGTRIGVIADNNGEFRLLAQTGSILMVTSSANYPLEIRVNETSSLSIRVTSRPIAGEVIIVTMGVVSTNRSSKRIKKQVIPHNKKLAQKKDMLNIISEKINAYPNPAITGSSITITLKNENEGYYSYQLTNLSGQTVHQQQIWIDKTAKVLSLDIPHIPAGTYMLSLINKISGNKLTEKIVVQ